MTLTSRPPIHCKCHPGVSTPLFNHKSEIDFRDVKNQTKISRLAVFGTKRDARWGRNIDAEHLDKDSRLNVDKESQATGFPRLNQHSSRISTGPRGFQR